jgi:hypothetical protein
MKLSATDVLRRGFDNAVANWHLLLIRFAESVLFVIVIVGAGFATVVPVVISIVSHPPTFEGADDLRDFMISHLGIFLYVIAVVTVLSLILIAIHSFVIAGAARVLIDGNRRASAALTRDRFRSFTFEHWLDGGREGWIGVFWIYNLVYGLVGLIVVIPFSIIAVAVLASLIAEMKVAAIASGCIGVPVVVFLAIFCSILGAVWAQKAIIVCIEERRGARDAMREGWREARADMSRHFGVAFVLFVIAVGGGGVISMLSFGFSAPGFAHGAGAALALMLLPLRLVLTAVSAVFHSAVGLWSLASFAALSEKA